MKLFTFMLLVTLISLVCKAQESSKTESLIKSENLIEPASLTESENLTESESLTEPENLTESESLAEPESLADFTKKLNGVFTDKGTVQKLYNCIHDDSVKNTPSCKAATEFFKNYQNSNPKDNRFTLTVEMILLDCFKENNYEDLCKNPLQDETIRTFSIVLDKLKAEPSDLHTKCSTLAEKINLSTTELKTAAKKEDDSKKIEDLTEFWKAQDLKKDKEKEEAKKIETIKSNNEAFQSLMSKIVEQVKGFIKGKKYKAPNEDNPPYRLPKSTYNPPPYQKQQNNSEGQYIEVHGNFEGRPTFVQRNLSLHEAQKFVKNPAYRGEIAKGCESSLGKKCSEIEMINFIQKPMK